MLNPQQPKQRTISIWHEVDMLSIKYVIIQFSQDFLSKLSLSTPINVLWEWEEFKTMCFKHLSLVPRITKQPWITSRIIYVAKNSMARSSKTTH